ncbi:phosphohistidine phosphatase [Pararhizobium capsulatum DSM 1112]|uniref:Phosphohistidine phosphatase n=1 Tax=Pararhizobium capsulatum DSM 1112 TaxID=1121113 RepID=A0ABU0BUH4_9HYPH|nr:histidine phosphatase family protein [Pararhizobium capsulatum]MDQ0320512.1 phosphohistidine phosphatase [Pararhizobium capsulatum DSM 1112]
MPAAFRLYLLRHARAAWAQPDQTDFERTLDDVGYADAEIVADKAADRGFVPALVLCSTAERCRQTIEPFRRTMGEELDIQFLDTLYTGAFDEYHSLISGNGNVSSLMVVGHNPAIQEVFFSLVGTTTAQGAAPKGFLPGMLAIIEFDTPPETTTSGNGKLAALISASS